MEPDHYYMPILHLPKEKMRLRNEVLRLFSYASVDYRELLYIPDTLHALMEQKECVCLHLVDHNELAPLLQEFEDVFQWRAL